MVHLVVLGYQRFRSFPETHNNIQIHPIWSFDPLSAPDMQGQREQWGYQWVKQAIAEYPAHFEGHKSVAPSVLQLINKLVQVSTTVGPPVLQSCSQWIN